MSRVLAAALALAAAGLACAPVAAQEGVEFGVRYWLSRGENKFAHNAQPADPTLGNPTSILTYEDLDGHALELYARAGFAERWFLRGHFGLGRIEDGSFDDEDYAAGQVKFLDTTSQVSGDRFSYFTLDVGAEVWRSAAGRSSLGLFLGVQQWRETVDANGLTVTFDPLGLSTNLPNSVRVISNEVQWRSLRVGLAGEARFGSRTRLLADAALVPYSRMRNDDSHYLRADLGPVPNVLTDGRGRGVQLDLELRHAFGERLELGVGLRHWRLRASSADVTLAGVTVPVTEFETRRTGVTASLTGRW